MSASALVAKSKLSGSTEAVVEKPLVSIKGLTKRYGLMTVLDDVSFDIQKGEVHAIVGENGAGKSTLARALSGFVEPSGGEIIIEGELVEDFSARQAERHGVILNHQELALAEHISVVDNMFLGHELHRNSVLLKKEMSRRAGSPDQAISSLPVSDKQMVEIAKALLSEAKLIIMDEPTAVLTPRETENLFAQIERLKSESVAVVYVSHKLDEVKQIADRVTVLHDGKFQGTWQADALSVQEIANLMVGRELSDIYPAKRAAAAKEVALEVRDYLGDTSEVAVTFDVFQGEVLGVAGLVGSGRTEPFESLVALRSGHGGKIFLHGKPFDPASYRDALSSGIAYITEDRKGRGLLLGESIAVNVSLLSQIMAGASLVDFAKERKALGWAIKQFNIEVPFPGINVGRLSGGNQQKVLLAKSLLNKPGVIIVDEPTRGIDVGTRAQIYQMLRQFADDGKAIVVISSDLQEIIGLSDRVMVMHDNSVAGFLKGDQVTEENVV